LATPPATRASQVRRLLQGSFRSFHKVSFPPCKPVLWLVHVVDHPAGEYPELSCC
jgi:hypothetical protein